MPLPTSTVAQRGIVLPLALVMLVMVTLIAVVAMRGVTSEERISANLRSSSVAFEQSELALRYCETIALTGGPDLESARIDSADVNGVAWRNPANWSTSYAKLQKPPATQYLDPARPVTAPTCLIESVRPPPSQVGFGSRIENSAFTITARGFGDNNGGFRTTVQTQLRPPPL
jgi:type IV pilus assembly protein PilX